MTSNATKKWTIQESQKATDIPFERARDWINRKFIIPDYKASRRGVANKLSLENLYQLKTFDFLIKHNVSREHAAEAVEQWQYAPDRPFMHIMRKANDVIVEWFEVIQNQMQVKHYTKDEKNHGAFEMMIVVDVGQIVKNIDAKVFPAKVKIT